MSKISFKGEASLLIHSALKSFSDWEARNSTMRVLVNAQHSSNSRHYSPLPFSFSYFHLFVQTSALGGM